MTSAFVPLLLILVFLSVGCTKKSTTEAGSCDQISVLSGGVCASPVTSSRLSLGNPNGHDDDPSVIFAQDGYFYLAYLSDSSGNKEIWITRSGDGSNWSSPIQITHHADEDIYPNLAQTSDGAFHLVWQRLITATGESHAYYLKTSDPLNWSGSENAVTTGLNDDTEPMFQVVDSSDFRIFFSSAQRSTGLGKPAYNRDIQLVRSINGGTSWVTPAVVTLVPAATDTVSDRFPWVIRQDTADFRMVFQRQATDGLFDPTSDLMVSDSTDGITWSAPSVVTSDSNDSEYDLFPNFYYAPLLGRWMISWLTTHWNATTGDLANLPLYQHSSYPAEAVNISSITGVSGWSTRVAKGNSDLSLMIWVSSQTGQPQLWSALLRL